MSYETGFTLEALQALEKSLASGELRVRYDDKEVEYRSFEEMRKLMALMRNSLGLGRSSGKKGLFGGSRINAEHSKGLD